MQLVLQDVFHKLKKATTGQMTMKRNIKHDLKNLIDR